jgi:hypothetical protein
MVDDPVAQAFDERWSVGEDPRYQLGDSKCESGRQGAGESIASTGGLHDRQGMGNSANEG